MEIVCHLALSRGRSQPLTVESCKWFVERYSSFQTQLSRMLIWKRNNQTFGLLIDYNPQFLVRLWLIKTSDFVLHILAQQRCIFDHLLMWTDGLRHKITQNHRGRIHSISKASWIVKFCIAKKPVTKCHLCGLLWGCRWEKFHSIQPNSFPWLLGISIPSCITLSTLAHFTLGCSRNNWLRGWRMGTLSKIDIWG